MNPILNREHAFVEKRDVGLLEQDLKTKHAEEDVPEGRPAGQAIADDVCCQQRGRNETEE
ncbi:MAG: hypothetical protein AAF772_06380 [Acidobacteriota bacterium]